MLPTSQKIMFSKAVNKLSLLYILTVTLTGYKLQCMSSSEHYPYNDEYLYI